MIEIIKDIKNYFFKKKIKFQIVEMPSTELTDVWSGNTHIGKLISENKKPIEILTNIDSFNFIRDLKAYGTIKTRALARKIVNYWIDNNQNFLSDSFEPSILANRISVICMTYSWFAKSGDEKFQKKLLKSLSQQLTIQELNFTKKKVSNIIKVLKSLIIGNIFLFDDKIKINSYLKEINAFSKELILLDGGSITRSPLIHFHLLRDLIEIRANIANINQIDSHELHKIVKLTGNYFKIFCMPDNSFAFFNGGSLINKEDVKQIQKRLGNRIKKFELAKFSGYARINNKNSNLIIDIGNKKTINSTFLKNNKASIGAIEYFYKNNKIITNLGDLTVSQDNRSLLSSTAAHSALSIDDRNNIDLSGTRKLELLNVKSNENNYGTLIEIEHDGYKNNFGVTHRRTLFVSQNGDDFRGEDQIKTYNDIGIIPSFCYIRFHLSPLIETFKLQSGKILLKHKDGYMINFISTEKNISIEKTMIFENGIRQKSSQLVIKILLSQIRKLKTLTCNWSFKIKN